MGRQPDHQIEVNGSSAGDAVATLAGNPQPLALDHVAETRIRPGDLALTPARAWRELTAQTLMLTAMASSKDFGVSRR
jgi:hypothetical protein